MVVTGAHRSEASLLTGEDVGGRRGDPVEAEAAQDRLESGMRRPRTCLAPGEAEAARCSSVARYRPRPRQSGSVDPPQSPVKGLASYSDRAEQSTGPSRDSSMTTTSMVSGWASHRSYSEPLTQAVVVAPDPSVQVADADEVASAVDGPDDEAVGEVDRLLREGTSVAEDEGLVVLLDEAGGREASAQVAWFVVVGGLHSSCPPRAEEAALGRDDAVMRGRVGGRVPRGQSMVACFAGSMPYSRRIGPSHSTR